MSPRRLGALLAAYAIALVVACGVIHFRYSMGGPHDQSGEEVVSIWKDARLVRRAVVRAGEPSPLRAGPGEQVAIERIVGESPVLGFARVVLGMSFVPPRDGLRIEADGKTIYLTPDDLLAFQIYDHGPRIEALGVGLGLDVDALERLAAERLGIPAGGLLERATLRRVRMERVTVPPEQPRPDGDHLSREIVEKAALAAASYLARGLGPEGHFRYLVDAPTDRTLPGYNWPRHAGATYFLAQGAGVFGRPELADASLRAARTLVREALRWCGGYHCIGTDPVVDLGSSALALLAFTEIVRVDHRAAEQRAGARPAASELEPYIPDLAGFVRSMQRRDGEFMHQFDRIGGHANDVQFAYYTSEAALALARAYELTRNPADLRAASAALDYIAGEGWHFFGDRYYFQEEHWTCQAMADLWNEAPNRRAFDLCARWAAFCRRLQITAGSSAFDADGAISMGPFMTPRLTPAASRAEGAIATLDVARRAGLDEREIAVLDEQVRRSLALVIRNQWLPGPTYLFAHPETVYGAIPGSPADWQVRIDYAQHAGSAMLRWLAVTARGASASTPQASGAAE